MNLKWYLFPIFVEMSHCISHFNRPKNIHSKSYHDKSQVVTADTQLRPHTSCILNGASRAAVVSLVTFSRKKNMLAVFLGQNFPEDFTFSDLIPPLKFNMDNYQELPCFKGVTFFQTTLFPSGIQSRTLERVPMKQHGLKNLMMTYVHLYTIYRSIVERTQPLNSKCMQGRIVESRYACFRRRTHMQLQCPQDFIIIAILLRKPLAAICKVANKSYQIIGSTATVCRCASHRLPW